MRIVIIIFLVLLSLSSSAQDIIVKKDGSIIQAKIEEIGSSEVKYKKWSYQDGPTYSIQTTDIIAINYPNGEKDVFETNEKQAPLTGLLDKPADSNNSTLIDQYKSSFKINNPKPKDKPADKGLLVFEFSPTSILSNEDIEINYIRSNATNDDMDYLHRNPLFRFEVRITNKTNNIIYIDLGNCFRMPSIGNAYCYFNGESVSVTQSRVSGTAVNLGGVSGALGIGGVAGRLAGAVTVGSGSSTSVSKTVSQQTVVSIPPYGSRVLSEFKYVTTKKSGATYGSYEMVSKGEELCYDDSYSMYTTLLAESSNLGIRKGIVNIDEVKYYSEGDSPFKIDYAFTYSTSPDFNTYSVATMSLFVKKIIGHIMTCDVCLCHKNWLKEYDILEDHMIIAPIKFQ